MKSRSSLLLQGSCLSYQLLVTGPDFAPDLTNRHIPGEGEIAFSQLAFMLCVFLSKVFGSSFINYFILFVILDSIFSSDLFSAIFLWYSSLSLGTFHAHEVGLINEARTMLCCVYEWCI